jgi:hypothetical protein
MTYYKSGDWNAICDVCGFQFKASQLRKRWDGVYVCAKDFEERHSLDFVRTKPDKIKVDFVRRPNDTYLNSACSIPGRHPYAGYATAGCAEVGYGLYTATELAIDFPIL